MVTRLVTPVHGGDIEQLVARYGNVPPWVDFSANLNPLGPPDAAIAALHACADEPNALLEYPTRRERLLRAALAQQHCRTPSEIVIANGAAALIEAFVRATAPKRCLLPHPAFSEYARALQAEKATVLPFVLSPNKNFRIDASTLLQALQKQQPDACIITNPHNPSGALIAPEDVLSILECCQRLNIALLLDEAFIDYVPEASILVEQYAEKIKGRCCIIRSLTKFYGMAGLRVGYGVAATDFAECLTMCIPSWPITAPAIDAVIAAIAETAYADTTRTKNAFERDRLTNKLEQIGIYVYPSVANFLLLRGQWNASSFAQTLAEQHHIAVRDCSSYGFEGSESHIRIAVRSHQENNRLIEAMQHVLERPLPS